MYGCNIEVNNFIACPVTEVNFTSHFLHYSICSTCLPLCCASNKWAKLFRRRYYIRSCFSFAYHFSFCDYYSLIDYGDMMIVVETKTVIANGTQQKRFVCSFASSSIIYCKMTDVICSKVNKKTLHIRITVFKWISKYPRCYTLSLISH